MSERQFYSIKAAADETAEVWIYDQIGESFWSEGVTAKQFVKDLSAIKAKRIDLHINSPGGSVFDGVAIFNALRNHPATVTTCIDGVAASIASIIALAGDRVTMAQNALYMIHNPWGYAQGSADEMRKMADMLDKVRETLLVTYRDKTGKDDAELTAMLDAETWMSADDALAHGFIDEITGALQIAACYDLKAFGFRHAPDLTTTGAAPVAAPVIAAPAAIVAAPINQAPQAEEEENTDMNTTAVAPAGAEIEVIQNRASDIVELCNAHGVAADAPAYIRAGLSADAVARKILAAKQGQTVAAPAAERADLTHGIDAKTLRDYSLFAAIRAAHSGNWKEAGREREVSDHLAKVLGRDPKGFMMPFPVLNTMTSGGTATGAEFVGTDHLASMFIDALRAQSILGTLGATMVEGLVGDVDIPKLSSGGTFYMVAEDNAPSASTPGTGSVTMSPKSGTGAVGIGRKLLKQSSPSMEAVIRNDLLSGIRLLVENMAINGSGNSNEPLGIIATPSVNTSTITSAGNPDWDEIVAFETAIAADNALMGNMAYLTTPAVKGAMKVKPRFTSTGLPIWADDGTVNGYKAMSSTLMPSNGIIFADWTALMIGFWGAIDLVVDNATDISKGGIILRPWADFDVAVRHVESFCINA